MNRLPPSLVYLVVYNPTLTPEKPPDDGDEDAEEQAHVLFYTANDHAVSRDKVLRQVGLAKALTNFTSIFESQMHCEAVHSQGRRMVMISPEPNFWIHACVELEKSIRPSKKEDKDKKAKKKQQEPVYDYNEGSLHDAALRTRLQLGYEAFKITHGSLTSILSRLGREALELQLERFFTVWAWSLDFGKEMPFSDYLGVRVHPLSNQLIPLIETLEEYLPSDYFPVVLASPCIIAPREPTYPIPSGLTRRLLSLIPSAISRTPSKDGMPKEDLNTQQGHNSSSENKTGTITKKFLGIPGIPAPNVTMNMDVRKWSWPAYLNFGASVSTTDVKGASTLEGKADGINEPSSPAKPTVEVDSRALQDALSLDTVQHDAGASEHQPAKNNLPSNAAEKDESSTADRVIGISSASEEDHLNPDTDSSGIDTRETSPPKPPISFMETRIHLPNNDPLDTHLKVIRYLRHDNLLLALIPSADTNDETTDPELAEKCMEVLERLQETIVVEQEKIATAFSSSPVQSVFQRSQHVITVPSLLNYTSTTFSATSWHLHEGRRTLEVDEDVLEVFSRGQSPADWHLVKRGLSTTDARGAVSVQGDVYMEIARKEASLTDVDNEIAGVIRRFLE